MLALGKKPQNNQTKYNQNSKQSKTAMTENELHQAEVTCKGNIRIAEIHVFHAVENE